MLVPKKTTRNNLQELICCRRLHWCNDHDHSFARGGTEYVPTLRILYINWCDFFMWARSCFRLFNLNDLKLSSHHSSTVGKLVEELAHINPSCYAHDSLCSKNSDALDQSNSAISSFGRSSTSEIKTCINEYSNIWVLVTVYIHNVKLTWEWKKHHSIYRRYIFKW